MVLKKDYNKKFKVLQVDGGGLKGVIPLIYLISLERMLDKKCFEIFDLMVGSSTGGIIATALASGYTAQEVLDFYLDNASKIFKKRKLWFINPKAWITGSRYNRKHIDSMMKKMFPKKMGSLKTDLILTGVNMRDAKNTHYFKSYKDKYSEVKTCYPLMATFSAPTFFGYFKDTKDYLKTEHKDGGLWADGGVGVENCTLLQSYIETKRKNCGDDYWILSCGTGYTGLTSEKMNMLSQIKDYIPIATEQAVSMQVNHCKELGVNFVRVDSRLNKKHDKMDKAKLLNKFIEYGIKMTNKNIKEIME